MPRPPKPPATGGRIVLPNPATRHPRGPNARPDSGSWQKRRERPGGKGGRPPRFPGRTGGR